MTKEEFIAKYGFWEGDTVICTVEDEAIDSLMYDTVITITNVNALEETVDVVYCEKSTIQQGLPAEIFKKIVLPEVGDCVIVKKPKHIDGATLWSANMDKYDGLEATIEKIFEEDAFLSGDIGLLFNLAWLTKVDLSTEEADLPSLDDLFGGG